jgi:hypothetical protein
MKKSRTLLLIAALLLISYLLPQGFSQHYSQTYQLLNEPNGSTHYSLSVTVQQSLYDYYVEKTHRLNSNTDFAKFVTPYALQPIANSLATIYADDEDFTNGVLMIVHQIPYEVTGPTKYPVETIVENKGDCDLFSYIAASIMKAQGMDVVLLYYEAEAHMNIGVSLSHVPNDAREQAYYVTYNSIHYYVAEATGGNWQDGWRVGECPTELKNAQVQVITLENSESWAPGQVSASYTTLASSTLSLTLSTNYLIQGGTVTLSGQLTPSLQNTTITIYIKVNTSPWVALDTVTTNNNGFFSYIWNADASGLCYIRASWSGNDTYAGADSTIQMITILSMFFILLLTMTAILVGVGIAIFVASRQNQPQIPEPQPPEVPLA